MASDAFDLVGQSISKNEIWTILIPGVFAEAIYNRHLCMCFRYIESYSFGKYVELGLMLVAFLVIGLLLGVVIHVGMTIYYYFVGTLFFTKKKKDRIKHLDVIAYSLIEDKYIRPGENEARIAGDMLLDSILNLRKHEIDAFPAWLLCAKNLVVPMACAVFVWADNWWLIILVIAYLGAVTHIYVSRCMEDRSRTFMHFIASEREAALSIRRRREENSKEAKGCE